jgi:transposase
LTVELKRQGADHRYVPFLVTAPGFGWINAYTVASEIGDIERFASPASSAATPDSARASFSPAAPAVAARSQSTARAIWRWGLFEAAMNACKLPSYAERYQRTRQRLGRQRGPKVAQIEPSRKLTEAIWHMLTSNQPFATAGLCGPGPELHWSSSCWAICPAIQCQRS